MGEGILNDYKLPLPSSYIQYDDLPTNFSWADTSSLTRSLNQHLPQWCGSCWAHAAMSSLADRIKIVRMANPGDERIGGPDIELSIQFILNCGSHVAGSCHGGSARRAFEFIKNIGYVPYSTCQPYIACSDDSTNGFCPFVDTTCSPINTCKTCTNPDKGGSCSEIDIFPFATVSEYGTYKYDVKAVMAEIYARGPVTAGIAGKYLHTYTGGIVSNKSLSDLQTTHEISIIGWATDSSSGKKYWICRNSWGEYWGEAGFFRISMGSNLLGIEEEVTWATPGTFTLHNFPCFEDGSNCKMFQFDETDMGYFVDPLYEGKVYGRELLAA